MSIVEMGIAGQRHPLVLLIDRVEHYLVSKAAHIVSPLPGVQLYLSSIDGRRFTTTWIPNGVAVGDWVPPEMQARSPQVVMYAGAMGVPNAIDVLIRAVQEVRARDWGEDRIVFRLVGDGVRKREAISMARTLGLKGIYFEKPVSKAEVPSLLSEATVLVVALRSSILYRYGVSLNKVAEYMAAARPVIIATDVTGDPIEASGCGVKVQADDYLALAEAIISLCEAPESDRFEMGLRGREYVKTHLSATQLAALLAETLDEVVQAAL